MAAQAIAHARWMRQSPAATEAFVWRRLRGGRLDGWRFRRQHPIGRYIVDFVCLRHRLIVELDGPFHDEVRDRERDAWLMSQGFRVLRFKNAEAWNDSENVITKILYAIA